MTLASAGRGARPKRKLTAAALESWGDAGKALLRTVFRAYHSASSGTPSQPRGEGSVAVDSGLITFTQIFLAGIANTSDHFNGSSVAPTGTCTRYGDRIPSAGEGVVRGGGR
eukprot:COSAG01_NODE_2907_length_6880_cov_10.488204_3_plen_112_part_00